MQLEEGKSYRDTANGFSFVVNSISDDTVTYTEHGSGDTYTEPLEDMTGFFAEPIVEIAE